MFIFGIVYLSIPVFLILFAFFSTPFVLLSAIALVVLIFCLCKSHHKEANTSFHLQTLVRYWPLLLVSFAITYLSASFNVWDWEKHFAVFNALIRGSWPPVVEIREQTWFLRYCAAWYIMPALFAKIFGDQFLTFAMIIWTITGVCSVLVIAFHKLQKMRHLFIAALVFFLFSGLDAIAALFTEHSSPKDANWLQWWAHWGQIFPNILSIAWQPQHTVGGWMAACLFLYNRRLALQYSGVIVVIAALWSPLCAIGLIPIVTWAAVKEGLITAITIQNFVITPLLILSIFLYSTQGAGQVLFTFAWQHPHFSLTSYLQFIVFEFLLILGILWWCNQQKAELIIIIAVFLLLLCLVREEPNNNLLGRGAIPAICIISILVTNSLLKNKRVIREILVSYIIIGMFPAVVAFAKAVTMKRVDKTITFEKFTSKYTYEEHPYNTYFYLVKTENVAKVFDVPILRGLRERQKIQISE